MSAILDKLLNFFTSLPNEKGKKVHEWMMKKRKERHKEWAQKQCEKREKEFKPFQSKLNNSKQV